MLNTDSHIEILKKKAVSRLLEKRKRLEETATELATMPASYGITGSVSVTNRNIADIKAEIADIDMQIKQILSGEPTGLCLSYPNYRWRGWL